LVQLPLLRGRGLDEHRHALIEAQQLRSHDSGAVQRLQLEMESLQETLGSQRWELDDWEYLSALNHYFMKSWMVLLE
jgi:hypothetical protein